MNKENLDHPEYIDGPDLYDVDDQPVALVKIYTHWECPGCGHENVFENDWTEEEVECRTCKNRYWAEHE